MESSLKRCVQIKIIYGYKGGSKKGKSIDAKSHTQEMADKLKQKF